MHAFRSRLALVLLLCFTRVLLPDAWILSLHTHRHTSEEPAHKPGGHLKGKAVLSYQHLHCAVDHFYQVPFQPAPPLALPAAFATYTPAHSWASFSVWRSATRPTADLRGPPGVG